MAVWDVKWSNSLLPDEQQGFDIHVLANSIPSQTLDSLLHVKYGSTAATADWHSAVQARADGLEVWFLPKFPFIPVFSGATPTGEVKHLTADAVIVKMLTGQVRLTAPLGAGPDVLRNFIIEASIKDENGVEFPIHPKIRIHLHNDIRAAWLTPSPYSLHHDPKPEDPDDLPRRPRLRVLAEFTDDSVGDLSGETGLIGWKAIPPANVDVNTMGGLKGLVDQGQTTIEATLPARFNDKVVTPAVVNALPPWSTPTAAYLVDQPKGKAKPKGNTLIAGRTNFLFLPEGFGDQEEPAFEALVTALAGLIRSSTRTWPFNLVGNRINFWWAFVPSPELGTSTMYETFPVARGNVDWWQEVPLPDFASPLTGLATLEQLVARVGLPTRANRAVTTLAGMLPLWATLYGPSVTADLDGHLDQGLYNNWLLLSERALVNEINSAFGIEIGERPRVFTSRPPRGAYLSDLRTRRIEHLDDFLNALTDGPKIQGEPDPPKIGDTWGAEDAPDRPFVCFLCTSDRGAGLRSRKQNVLSVGLGSGIEIVTVSPSTVPPGATRALELGTLGITGKPSLDVQTTVVHEFAHSIGTPGFPFGLGDEYGELSELRIPTSDESDVAVSANLQTETDLLKLADPMNGDNIRWARWHRIKKAALLKDATVLLPDRVRLEVVRLPPEGLAPGDQIRLRHRPLATARPASPELTIEVFESAKVFVAKMNDKVAFLAWRVLGEVGAGAIVFVSERPNGVEAMLVAKVIRDHITTTQRPLNADPVVGPNPPAHVCKATGDETQPASNRPPLASLGKHPRFSAYIVGLYDGGARHDCGVFHPAGACIMRRQLVPENKLPAGTSPIYAFCDVCRYILVDNLDPTQHGKNDRNYQDRWPEQ